MSHELTIRTNNQVEHAYVGDTPWHGLGQRLTEGAPIETWQNAAGMDWKIQRSKVRYHFGADADDFKTWDDQHVLFRSDTKAPLGLVSPGYKTVQPRQVLEFFRDLVEESGYRLHTAGTLFGGRKFWALAKVAEAVVADQDRVGGYLLLSTSCDGSMATEARETTVRVVCNNTLSMARAVGSKGSIKVGHRSTFNAAAVKREMGLTAEHFDSFMDAARALSNVRVSNAAANAFVRNLLRPIETPDDQRAPKGEADILRLFRGEAIGSGMASGSAWQMVNAVTQWVDHVKTAKSIDHRLDAAFFGAGDDLKNRAFELAMAL